MLVSKNWYIKLLPRHSRDFKDCPWISVSRTNERSNYASPTKEAAIVDVLDYLDERVAFLTKEHNKLFSENREFRDKLLKAEQRSGELELRIAGAQVALCGTKGEKCQDVVSVETKTFQQ